MRSFESRVHSQYTQLFTVVKPGRARIGSGRNGLPPDPATRCGTGRSGSILKPEAEVVLTRLGRGGSRWPTVGDTAEAASAGMYIGQIKDLDPCGFRTSIGGSVRPPSFALIT